ncbi:cytochrome P450 [Sporodiniella umbellata]|nr:cytochrome P450 [Sporodiniella umbellata]
METVESIIKHYQGALDRFLPIVQKRSKKTYIGAAIALITLQRIYSYFRVPKNLRHLSKIPFFSMAKAQYNREPPHIRYKKITQTAIIEGGGIYVSKIPFDWTVFVANPMVAKHVLMKAESNPKSHDFLDIMGPNSPFVRFLGYDTVGIINGQSWKRQRKVMNPAFHRSMPIKTMASVMPSLFSAIEKKEGEVLVSELMKDFTLDVLGLTIFGFEFKALQGDPELWTSTYSLVNDGLFDPLLNVMGSFSFLLTLIFPEKRKQMNAVTRMNAKLAQLIEEKRQEVIKGIHANKPENEKDLVTLMLEAEQANERIKDEELRHNVAGFFLAGHDTTAHTLSFCLYNLAKNKDVQNKLRQEIIAVLGDDPVDIEPTLEELKQMEYLNLVIKENLRHSGPADSLLPRVAREDIAINGTFIPKGSTINLDIYAIHHDPKYWTDAEEFIPERFDIGGEQENHEGLTWLPFSNGARQCIGMNFSLTEQRLLLTMLLRKYEVDISQKSIHYDRVVINDINTKAPDSLGLIFTKRY